MLSDPPLWLALVLGGVLIPLLAWWAVGARRRRDPLLLPLTIFTMAFGAAGLGNTASGGDLLNWYLMVGLVAAVALRSRWRQASKPAETHPEV